MKIRNDEGAAIHIDPEPRVGVRKDVGEASAGAGTGQPVSRENWISVGADALVNAEGNRSRESSRAPVRPGVVAEPGMNRN